MFSAYDLIDTNGECYATFPTMAAAMEEVRRNPLAYACIRRRSYDEWGDYEANTIWLDR
jgi:hypothetical protein